MSCNTISRYDLRVTENGNNNYTVSIYRRGDCPHGRARMCFQCRERRMAFIDVQLDGTPEALRNFARSIDQQIDAFQQLYMEEIDYWRQQSLNRAESTRYEQNPRTESLPEELVPFYGADDYDIMMTDLREEREAR